ncbi:hypothetical protein L596_015557 [Steinernema carpocapsae]|uniref:Uncharacterized protein n=1 Tax=Steinernema carpocapsae TaxID=34508 RepID=A0A4U5NG86_STECR|nr:hypothetical protein L596_015557 [Steinernema carpocapsae]
MLLTLVFCFYVKDGRSLARPQIRVLPGGDLRPDPLTALPGLHRPPLALLLRRRPGARGPPLKIVFHKLQLSCDLKPNSIFVETEGQTPVAMCGRDSNVFVAPGGQATIRYISASGLAFDVVEMTNRVHCSQALTYNQFGRSLVLESSNASCLVTFPGRVRVTSRRRDSQVPTAPPRSPSSPAPTTTPTSTK